MCTRRFKFIGAAMFTIAISCLSYVYLRTSLIMGRIATSNILKRLDVENFRKQTDFECYNVTLNRLTFPMCFYDDNSDRNIATYILQGKYFEADKITKIVNFLHEHRDVTFLDLGANLGMYSLPVGHSGIHVMAVEANGETARRLAKAVYLGKIQDTVDIFHYAISNEKSTSFLRFDSANRGNTYMVGNISCPGCLSVEVTTLNNLIPFVKNKKVLFKVDIQESEINVFTPEGAGKFFDEFDVLMIQMEWGFYPINYGKEETGRRRVVRFLEFFYKRGYEVYHPRSEKKLSSDWIKWPYDVIFKRGDLRKEKLFQI